MEGGVTQVDSDLGRYSYNCERVAVVILKPVIKEVSEQGWNAQTCWLFFVGQ